MRPSAIPREQFTPSSSVRPVDVQFAGRVSPETIDTEVANALAAARVTDEQRIGLVLDFREVAFIQLPALHCVIALSKALQANGHKVAFRIPRSRDVREMWKRWAFSEGLEAVLGYSLWDLVPQAERKLSSETLKHYTAIEYPAGPTYGPTSIRSDNFFSIHSEHLRRGKVTPLLATQEVNRWTAEYVQEFLLRKASLSTDAVNYLPGRIVFEAYMNSMRHPAASIVQISAFNTRSHGKPTSFAVNFWDDGVSMIDTLYEPIKAKRSVQTSFSREFARRYLLRYSADDDINARYDDEIDSGALGIDPHATTPVQAFCYTIFAGVTSNPLAENLAVADEVSEANPEFARPGMGLFVLINAVVEVLGGQVSFRTSRYFMNVRRLEPAERKQFPQSQIVARIKERSSSLPEFRGNLITVRLYPSLPSKSR